MSLPAYAAEQNRPRPDKAAIEEVLRGTGQPDMNYVSARAVEHYLRARLALENGVPEQASEELSLCAVYDPQSAWPRYAMAVEHLRHGEKSEADTDLRVALQINPRHAPSLRLRARLLLEEGRITRAIEALTEAAREGPRDPEPFALLAKAFIARGQLAAAQAVVERVDALALGLRESDPVPVAHALEVAADANVALAEAFEAAGRHAQAETYYRRGVDRDPDSVRRLDALTRFLEGQGRFDEAAKQASRTLAYAEEEPQRILSVARLFLSAGQPKSAAAYVHLLASAEAPRGDALVALGTDLLGAGEADGALKAFDAALAVAPERVDARWYAGLALETVERFDEALEAYRAVAGDEGIGTIARARAAWCEHRLGRTTKALNELRSLLPDEDVVLVHARVLADAGRADDAIALVRNRWTNQSTRRLVLELASLYRKHRRAPDAVALLEPQLRKAPGDEALTWALAQSLAAAARVTEALATAKSMLVRHPKRGDVANFIAWLLAEHGGDLDSAESFAYLALELEPGRWEYLDTLGRVQFKARRFPQAVQTLERARQQAPDDLEVMLHLAEALAASGDPDGSRSLLEPVVDATRSPKDAALHERAARLLESLNASRAPTAEAGKSTPAP